jgi:hypothetical protein
MFLFAILTTVVRDLAVRAAKLKRVSFVHVHPTAGVAYPIKTVLSNNMSIRLRDQNDLGWLQRLVGYNVTSRT